MFNRYVNFFKKDEVQAAVAVVSGPVLLSVASLFAARDNERRLVDEENAVRAAGKEPQRFQAYQTFGHLGYYSPQVRAVERQQPESTDGSVAVPK